MGKTQRPARATRAKPWASEVQRPRLDLFFSNRRAQGNTVRFALLLELAKASGLSVPEVRQGLDGIRDTLLENLTANRYSRIPEMLSFRGAMQQPKEASASVINGKPINFNARAVHKKVVKGTVLKPLRKAFSSAA